MLPLFAALHTTLFALTSAPASRSSCTSDRLSGGTSASGGVPLKQQFGSAPASSSRRSIPSWPLLLYRHSAAHIVGLGRGPRSRPPPLPGGNGLSPGSLLHI